MPDPVLLPRPRELRYRGGGEARLDRLAGRPDVECDATLPAQGYELRAGSQRVRVAELPFVPLVAEGGR